MDRKVVGGPSNADQNPVDVNGTVAVYSVVGSNFWILTNSKIAFNFEKFISMS